MQAIADTQPLARVVEPTKVCSRCSERKPWSAFYKCYRHGTASPLSRCKECDKAHRKEFAARNPDRQRAYTRTYYERMKGDPERYYARLERERQRKRVKRGTDPAKFRASRILKVSPAPGAFMDPRPFVEFLRSLGNTHAAISLRCGIGPDYVRALLRGEYATVHIDTVDRAIIRADVVVDGLPVTLDSLYPLDQDQAA